MERVARGRPPPRSRLAAVPPDRGEATTSSRRTSEDPLACDRDLALELVRIAEGALARAGSVSAGGR